MSVTWTCTACRRSVMVSWREASVIEAMVEIYAVDSLNRIKRCILFKRKPLLSECC